MRQLPIGIWLATSVVLALSLTPSKGFSQGRIRNAIRGLIDQRAQDLRAQEPKLAFAAMPPTQERPLADKTVQQLIDPLEAAIEARPAKDRPFRIAVFPFGGEPHGNVTEDNVGDVHEVQGVLTATLRTELLEFTRRKQLPPGTFTILDPFALKRVLATSGVEGASIGPNNPELASLLRQLGIDAAVVGRTKDRSFQAKIVFSEPERKQPQVNALVAVRDNSAPFSNLNIQRFNVSMFCSTDLADLAGDAPSSITEIKQADWRRVPIVTRRDGGAYHQKLYALIPDEARRASFKLNVANNRFARGKLESYPAAIGNRDPELEAQRIFGVVLTVDGINSICEDNGAGETKPLPMDARAARKWLLSPRGYVIEPDANGEATLAPAQNGWDHSELEIVGFQYDERTATRFQLAEVGQGQGIIAEQMNMNPENIGLISVYFFAQKLPGDALVHWEFPTGPTRSTGPGNTRATAGPPEPDATLGTAEGNAVSNPVVGVHIDFHSQPVHEIHILYRTEDALPIPREQRLVLQN